MITKDRKVTYYASRISDNILETPEGYLICKDVPIARTGIQEYLGQELGLNDKFDQYVKVYREEEDVFDPASIASFEGKPFTDEHPPVEVDINNINQYSKGHVQNVRRSKTDTDLLIADIIAQDSQIISEIKNKLKREISNGYDSVYVPYKDGYRQVEIRGNHIALVTKGRAGSRVSIKDNNVERKKRMAKKNIFAAMLKSFAKDADPDEVAEALDALNQKDAEEEKAKMATLKGKEEEAKDDDPLSDLASRLEALENKFNKLYSAEKKEGHSELDADPEEEEVFDEDPEEDVEEDVEEDLDEEETEDEESEEEVEEKVKVSKDSLVNLKSTVARIRNPYDRKRVSDAMIKAFGRSSSSRVYDTINKLAIKSAKKRTSDSQSRDLEELGKKIAAKYNPHYKENN